MEFNSGFKGLIPHACHFLKCFQEFFQVVFLVLCYSLYLTAFSAIMLNITDMFYFWWYLHGSCYKLD